MSPVPALAKRPLRDQEVLQQLLQNQHKDQSTFFFKVISSGQMKVEVADHTDHNLVPE